MHLVLLRRATEERVDAEGRLADGVAVLIGRAEHVARRRGRSSGRGCRQLAATTRPQFVARDTFPAGIVRVVEETGGGCTPRVILRETLVAGEILVVSDHSVVHVIR